MFAFNNNVSLPLYKSYPIRFTSSDTYHYLLLDRYLEDVFDSLSNFKLFGFLYSHSTIVAEDTVAVYLYSQKKQYLKPSYFELNTFLSYKNNIRHITNKEKYTNLRGLNTLPALEPVTLVKSTKVLPKVLSFLDAKRAKSHSLKSLAPVIKDLLPTLSTKSFFYNYFNKLLPSRNSFSLRGHLVDKFVFNYDASSTVTRRKLYFKDFNLLIPGKDNSTQFKSTKFLRYLEPNPVNFRSSELFSLFKQEVSSSISYRNRLKLASFPATKGAALFTFKYTVYQHSFYLKFRFSELHLKLHALQKQRYAFDKTAWANNPQSGFFGDHLENIFSKQKRPMAFKKVVRFKNKLVNIYSNKIGTYTGTASDYKVSPKASTTYLQKLPTQGFYYSTLFLKFNSSVSRLDFNLNKFTNSSCRVGFKKDFNDRELLSGVNKDKVYIAKTLNQRIRYSFYLAFFSSVYLKYRGNVKADPLSFLFYQFAFKSKGLKAQISEWWSLLQVQFLRYRHTILFNSASLLTKPAFNFVENNPYNYSKCLTLVFNPYQKAALNVAVTVPKLILNKGLFSSRLEKSDILRQYLATRGVDFMLPTLPRLLSYTGNAVITGLHTFLFDFKTTTQKSSTTLIKSFMFKFQSIKLLHFLNTYVADIKLNYFKIFKRYPTIHFRFLKKYSVTSSVAVRFFIFLLLGNKPFFRALHIWKSTFITPERDYSRVFKSKLTGYRLLCNGKLTKKPRASTERFDFGLLGLSSMINYLDSYSAEVSLKYGRCNLHLILNRRKMLHYKDYKFNLINK